MKKGNSEESQYVGIDGSTFTAYWWIPPDTLNTLLKPWQFKVASINCKEQVKKFGRIKNINITSTGNNRPCNIFNLLGELKCHTSTKGEMLKICFQKRLEKIFIFKQWSNDKKISSTSTGNYEYASTIASTDRLMTKILQNKISSPGRKMDRYILEKPFERLPEIRYPNYSVV